MYKLFLLVVVLFPFAVATAAGFGWRGGSASRRQRPPLGDGRTAQYLELVDRASAATERGDIIEAERLWRAANRLFPDDE